MVRFNKLVFRVPRQAQGGSRLNLMSGRFIAVSFTGGSYRFLFFFFFFFLLSKVFRLGMRMFSEL